MATTNLNMQDFFSTTLAQALTNSGTTIYVNAVPTATEGYLVLEKDNASKREIIYYTAKGANYVTAAGGAGVGRGMGGTTAQAHDAGASVDMTMTSGYWNGLKDGTAISDNVITARMTEELPKATDLQSHTTNTTVTDPHIQYGYKTLVCGIGTAVVEAAVTLPVAYDNTSYSILFGGVNTSDFATDNEAPTVNWNTKTANGFAIRLVAKSGNWAANRTTNIWWMTIGKKAR